MLLSPVVEMDRNCQMPGSWKFHGHGLSLGELRSCPSKQPTRRMAGAVAARVEVQLSGHCNGSVWEHTADVAKQPLSNNTQAKAGSLDMLGKCLDNVGRIVSLLFAGY